eukprot:6203704-Pleurochrysis_carterae.AAC.3
MLDAEELRVNGGDARLASDKTSGIGRATSPRRCTACPTEGASSARESALAAPVCPVCLAASLAQRKDVHTCGEDPCALVRD